MRLTETFDISPSDRVMVVGMTGSGKSQFAEYLAREYSSIIVLDYKREIDWDGFKVITDPRDLRKVGTSEEWSRVIFQVPLDWEKADYDKFFKWIITRKNTRVCVDEGMVVGDHGSYPKHLKILVVVGRSLGCGLIFLCQRPKTIPKFILTNSEHKFVFFLDEEDREVLDRKGDNIPWDTEIAHESYAFIHLKAGKRGYDGPYILDLAGD